MWVCSKQVQISKKKKNHRQLEAEKTSSHSRFQPREINDLLAEKEEEEEKEERWRIILFVR